MYERVRLRDESTMVQEKVMELEDEIKEDFLSRKPIVIEQDELDYIDRI